MTYINAKEKDAVKTFINEFSALIRDVKSQTPIVLLCIGTDRVTGDSFGPLIGYKLKKSAKGRVFLYGTLEKPVHAKNLCTTVDEIYKNFEEPFVIAIDASLGRAEHIGCLSLGRGGVSAGAGVNKDLPKVGDIFITGVVNYFSSLDGIVLQNTRLNVVMSMADVVSLGIKRSLRNI